MLYRIARVNSDGSFELLTRCHRVVNFYQTDVWVKEVNDERVKVYSTLWNALKAASKQKKVHPKTTRICVIDMDGQVVEEF